MISWMMENLLISKHGSITRGTSQSNLWGMLKISRHAYTDADSQNAKFSIKPIAISGLQELGIDEVNHQIK